MHRREASLILLLVAVAASCGSVTQPTLSPSVAAEPSQDQEAAARLAIEEFAPEDDLNLAFSRIHEVTRENPATLREEAMRRLGAEDSAIRFAAVYALSLCAADGPSADALESLLASDRSNERLLAAAGLIPLGRREAVPVLIAALDDETLLDHRDPPRPAWDFARSLLLAFTEEDLGLGAATTRQAVSATKGAWESWWNERGTSLLYRPADRRFVEGP